MIEKPRLLDQKTWPSFSLETELQTERTTAPLCIGVFELDLYLARP
jgi:hypothetical protein